MAIEVSDRDPVKSPAKRWAHVAVPVAAALLGIVAPAAAKPQQAAMPELNVYLFVLDGLDRDSVLEGDAPFISSMMAGENDTNATFFPNSRSVMVAETNPNHTSMIT